MSKTSLSRREFVGLSAAAAALVAKSTSTKLEAAPAAPSPADDAVAPGHKFGTEAEMAMAADWAQAFSAPTVGSFTKAKTGLLPKVLPLPFSFGYDGARSGDFLHSWKMNVKSDDKDPAFTSFEVIYTDPTTGLIARVKGVVWKDFPAVEWTLHFRNTGRVDTPILEDVQALDTSLECPEGDPTIHYAKGATCSMDDFKPLTRVLSYNGSLHLQPGEGDPPANTCPSLTSRARAKAW